MGAAGPHISPGAGTGRGAAYKGAGRVGAPPLSISRALWPFLLFSNGLAAGMMDFAASPPVPPGDCRLRAYSPMSKNEQIGARVPGLDFFKIPLFLHFLCRFCKKARENREQMFTGGPYIDTLELASCQFWDC